MVPRTGSQLLRAVVVQHAAREGARYGVTGQIDCDAASPSREACIEYMAEEATTGLSGAPGNVNVTFTSWEYPDYITEHADSAGEQCDALEVEVEYDFAFVAPIVSSVIEDLFGWTEFTISGKERLLNEPFGPCG